MDYFEFIRDILVVFILIALIAIPSTLLFFVDGGQIYGVNDNPDKIPKPDGTVVNGLAFEIVYEDIEPIDDGTQIISVELWQLPLPYILSSLITRNMVYIPPSFAHLLSLFYLSLNLVFFILYRQRIETKGRDPDSRREIIYQTIQKNPGISQQKLVDVTGFSRGSVRHHLTALLKSREIIGANKEGHLRYLVKPSKVTIEEEMLVISLAEKRSLDLLLELNKREMMQGCDLAKSTGQTLNLVRYHIRKLEGRGLILRKDGKGGIYYSLSKTAREGITRLIAETEFVENSLDIHEKSIPLSLRQRKIYS